MDSDDKSAVNGENLPGGIGGRSQVDNGVGYLFRSAEAAERNLFCQHMKRVLSENLNHVCVDHSRGNAVDADACRSQLSYQRAGQTDNSMFGAGIGHLAGSPMAAPDGADVDDATLMGGQHVRQDCLNGVEASAKIDGEHPVPGLRCDILKLNLPPRELIHPPRLGVVLRGVVLRGVVLRGVVLRGVVLRGVVLR